MRWATRAAARFCGGCTAGIGACTTGAGFDKAARTASRQPQSAALAGAVEAANANASTPVDTVFEIRAGVCQDLAHVGIAAMRSIGLPARYVSGYLLTQPPPSMPRMLGADASHAWFSVFAPPYGWVDLDPTNDVLIGEGHVTVAWGRDYSDVAPVTGIILGGHDHVVDVGVDVIPVTE